MPFVKKNDARGPQPANDGKQLFVGRSNELHFFREHILKPDDPAYNVISVYGDGGVGKSTLIARFVDEARAPEYSEYCLTALVNERQTTPAAMMEKFAEQLRIRSEFRRALARYKEVLHKLQSEQETIQDAVLQRAPDFAGAAVEGVPFVGPLLRESLKMTTERVLHEYRAGAARKDVERLEDPIGNLTGAFVAELNRLAEAQVTLGAQWTRRRRRIVLCFDTFEQLASEAAPWLLDYFLVADISSNVVLVVAGRDPVDRSMPDDPKRWLPYRDGNVIYSLSLNSFSEEETRAYLERRGITDPARINRIWRLSRGLPLYLSLLTSDPAHEVDPTADVVANFLRWIPESEEVKRRLVLDAALFSHPFNQDDLAAFAYITEPERPALYRWLIKQPFVSRSNQDGRYSFHELAEDLFSRHIYQESPNTCYATRRALIAHYRNCLATIEASGGKKADHMAAWLGMAIALAQQLFLLPDEASHIEAIEALLAAHDRTKQDEEITRVLRDLFQEQLYNQANADARASARILTAYLEAEPTSQDFATAASRLLKKIAHARSFSPRLLATIYDKRGVAYRNLDDRHSAIEDFDQAIALDARYAMAYGNRGITYRTLKQYEQALRDFNTALALDKTLDWVYAGRGEVYRHRREYQRALEDFNHALALDPEYALAYAGRGRVYRFLKQYEQAIQDLDHALSLGAEVDWVYVQLGEAFRALNEHERAIEEYNRAIALNPEYFWAYGSRGLAYFRFGDYPRALADFDRSIALNPDYDFGYAQRGRLYRHMGQYERAITDFDRALALDPNDAWTCSQRGLACTSLQAYEQAFADFDRSIALDPAYGRAYGRRGSAHLLMNDLEKAYADYARNCEIDPDDMRAHWMYEWIGMCRRRPDAETARRLEKIAARQPLYYFAHICRGVAHWLNGQAGRGLTELAQARRIRSAVWDAFFWHGLITSSLGQPESMPAIEQALSLGMPPILLIPLRWLEQDQPALYEQQIRPLLTQYDMPAS